VKEEEGVMTKQRILECLQAFKQFISKAGPNKIQIHAVTYCLPGRVEGDKVVVPHWVDGEEEIRFEQSEFATIELSESRAAELINEIQALGHGLISTDEFFGLEDDFTSLWKPPAMDIAPTLYPLYFSSDAATVIHVAKSLSVAFIVPIDSVDSYRVIASEWSHALVQVCGPDEPGYQEELRLKEFIAKRKNGEVEWEDICSAQGLNWCYEFELQTDGQPQVHVEGEQVDVLAEIQRDLSDPIVERALRTHFKFLMRFARMCAISFTCKSVFMTYSVLDKGTELLRRHVGVCRDEFMHFTKSEWVSNVSVFVQTSEKNISAVGVMYHALTAISGNNKNKETGDAQPLG
jgi:hypothetical protein